MAEYRAIKGFADLFPEEAIYFTRMEECAKQHFSNYGYGELRTPAMEYTDLFKRSIGLETDVVQKEMFTMTDSKGRGLTLRPEATAGIMRAYLEHNVQAREAVSKFFTIGPMFRHERPQKGRLRQFHQINCECLGAPEPEADAELIAMLMSYLDQLGIADLSLQLNTLGCAQCRPAYRALLREWLLGLDQNVLCEDCRRRVETNPLRVLDCKVPSCREHTEKAPALPDNVCPDCQAHFAKVTALLDGQDIAYTLNSRLVRGLDYYTRTTFEVVSSAIGSQGSVAGGGRYDDLLASLGGPATPGLGFACGMERLAMLMPKQDLPRPDFFLAALHSDCLSAAFALAQKLRACNLSGSMAFEARSLKSLLRQANKSNAKFALLLGPDELAAGQVLIKNLDDGVQSSVDLIQAADYLATPKG